VEIVVVDLAVDPVQAVELVQVVDPVQAVDLVQVVDLVPVIKNRIRIKILFFYLNILVF
jgi:hypothetical protein